MNKRKCYYISRDLIKPKHTKRKNELKQWHIDLIVVICGLLSGALFCLMLWTF